VVLPDPATGVDKQTHISSHNACLLPQSHVSAASESEELCGELASPSSMVHLDVDVLA
jgi:hypothetical protein